VKWPAFFVPVHFLGIENNSGFQEATAGTVSKVKEEETFSSNGNDTEAACIGAH